MQRLLKDRVVRRGWGSLVGRYIAMPILLDRKVRPFEGGGMFGV